MEEGEALKYTHETRDKTYIEDKLFQVQNTALVPVLLQRDVWGGTHLTTH